MILEFNKYVNKLLDTSREYRNNPGSENAFTAEEIHLIYKSAAAFEEIVHNLRMGALNNPQKKINAAQIRRCWSDRRE